MTKIDFEAHYFYEGQLRALMNNHAYPKLIESEEQTRRIWHTPDVGQPYGDALYDGLRDLGDGRIAEMDACGVDVQILSVTAPSIDQLPPDIGVPMAHEANSALAEVIDRHPDRFKGFAVLSPTAPDQAAAELERAVKELGFVGWNTHSNIAGAYLDEERFRPIFATAEALNIPVYLHPAVPAMPQTRTYGFAIAGAAFGFGMETAMTMLRLIYSGLFDKHPDLTIIMGHLGEALPFLMKRMDWAYVRPFDPNARPNLSKKPSDYMRNNVYVTTSGNYFEPAFMCTREAMGIDRILLATDYPYEDPKEGIAFVEELPISVSEKEKIFSGNAARLGISLK